jgi:hypothetical protein
MTNKEDVVNFIITLILLLICGFLQQYITIINGNLLSSFAKNNELKNELFIVKIFDIFNFENTTFKYLMA